MPSVVENLEPCKYAILKKKIVELVSSNDGSEPQVLNDLLDNHTSDFLNACPFNINPKNVNDRQAISSRKVDKYPNLPMLTNDQINGIFSISDMYNMNEIICLDYWVKASDPSTRRWLESELNQDVNFYENQLVNVVITLYEHDMTCILEILSLLFKCRHDLNLVQEKKDVFVNFTNKLIKSDIITRLLQYIRNGVSERASLRSFSFVKDSLSLLVDAVFLATYQTQITQAEYQLLSDTIQSLSEILSSESASEKASDDWQLFSLLPVLLVTHLSVLGQTSVLYNREADLNIETVGNNLYQNPLSRDGLDRPWKGSKGVKGVVLLAHAILRQPLIDSDMAPVSDGVWFLFEGSQHRGYSFVRLCLVPALQSRDVGSSDILPLLCGVVGEFIRNLVMIITLPMYRFHHESGHPFFPDEQRNGDDKLSDTFEDLLLLIHDFSLLWPSTADYFWNIDDDESQGSAVHHPFIQLAAKAAGFNKSLLPSTWRLFASLSGGTLGYTATYVYQFLRLSHRHQELSWPFLFGAISKIAASLTDEPTTQTSGGRYVDGIGTTGIDGITRVVVAPGLSYEDLDMLQAILELIAAVVQNAEVSVALLSLYQPLDKLFELIPCPITISGATPMESAAAAMEVRSKAFEIIARIVRADPKRAEEVWEFLESKQALPVKSRQAGSVVGFLSWRGVREDLEDSESKTKKYPVTESFLHLLQQLISAADPNDGRNIAIDTSIENAAVYIDYVIEDVLMKASSREYAPDGSAGRGQEYCLVYRCLSVLIAILQQYDPKITTDYEEDFPPLYPNGGKISQGWSTKSKKLTKSKSLGFHVMSMLLGQSRLLQKVFSVLDTCSPSNWIASIHTRGDDVCKDSIEIMQQTRIDVSSAGASGLSLWSSLHSSDKSLSVNDKAISEPDLSFYGISPTSKDCSYWQQMASIGAMGLLYECMLREKKFMEKFRSSYEAVGMETTPSVFAASPLSNESQKKALFYPSIIFQPRPLQGFAEILCDMSILGIIANYITVSKVDGLIGESNPSLAVMAIKILTYVVSYSPSKVVLGSLIPSSRDEITLQRQLINALLLTETDEMEETRFVLVQSRQRPFDISLVIEPLGGFELLASFSNIFQSEPAFQLFREDLKHASAILSSETNCFSTALNVCIESRKEAVLNLFLISLLINGSTIGLSHYLLGYREWKALSVDEFNGGEQRTCLKAILQLIGTENDRCHDFMISSPLLMTKCYQIIYLLVNTNNQAAAVLRSPVSSMVLNWIESVDFIRKQMAFMTDSWFAFNSGEKLSRMFINAESDYRTCLLDCCSYLFLIAAHNWRRHRLSNESSTKSSHVMKLWRFFLLSEGLASLSNVDEEISPLGAFLSCPLSANVYLLDDDSIMRLQTISSSKAKELIDQFTEAVDSPLFTSSRGVSSQFYQINTVSFKREAQAALADASVDPSNSRVTMFNQSFSAPSLNHDDYDEAILAIKSFNMQQRQILSASQYFHSYQQLLTTIFSNLAEDFFDSPISPPLDLYQTITNVSLTGLFIPILQVLDSCANQSLNAGLPSVDETIIHPSIVHDLCATASAVICSLCDGLIRFLSTFKSSSALSAAVAIFPGTVFGGCIQIVTDIIRALHVRRNCAVATRGLVHAILTRLLQYPRQVMELISNYSFTIDFERELDPVARYMSSEEIKSSSSDNYSHLDSAVAMQALASKVLVYEETSREVLSTVAVELTDVLCQDATDGYVESRLTAMAAITLVFASINPLSASLDMTFVLNTKHSSAPASPVFESCVNLIAEKGYLRVFLSYFLVDRVSYASLRHMNEVVTIVLDETDRNELIESAIGLCQHMASSIVGVRHMVAGAFFEVIHRCNFVFKAAYYRVISSEESVTGGVVSASSRSTDKDDTDHLKLITIPVFKLLSIIGNTAALPLFGQSQGSAQASTVNQGILSVILNPACKSFMHEVFSLNPLKSSLSMSLVDAFLQVVKTMVLSADDISERNLDCWFVLKDVDHFLGFHGEALILFLDPSNDEGAEHTTYATVLRILSNLSSIYRIRYTKESVTSLSSQDHSNVSVLVPVFAALGSLYLRLLKPSSSRERSHISGLLRGASEVMCENLLCGIAGYIQLTLEMQQTSIPDGGILVAKPVTDVYRAVHIAEQFPSGSFVRKVGRWLKDHSY